MKNITPKHNTTNKLMFPLLLNSAQSFKHLFFYFFFFDLLPPYSLPPYAEGSWPLLWALETFICLLSFFLP